MDFDDFKLLKALLLSSRYAWIQASEENAALHDLLISLLAPPCAKAFVNHGPADMVATNLVEINKLALRGVELIGTPFILSTPHTNTVRCILS